MTRILLTAFEPFGQWSTNSSQLCLEAFRAQWLAEQSDRTGLTIEFRIYPVDFRRARQQIEADARGDFDYAIHLGQAADSATIRLERFALNVGLEAGQASWLATRLERDGPAAYETRLPIAEWAERLSAVGLPAEVSFHAGTYLCNAVFYWSCFFSRRHKQPAEAVFLHLPRTRADDEPLEVGPEHLANGSREAVADSCVAPADGAPEGSGGDDRRGLAAAETAQAVRLIVGWLANRPTEGKNV